MWHVLLSTYCNIKWMAKCYTFFGLSLKFNFIKSLILNLGWISNDKNDSKFNTSCTLNHLHQILLLKGFPIISRMCSNFPQFFSFDFIEILIKGLFHVQWLLHHRFKHYETIIYRTPTHQGLSNNTNHVMGVI